MIIEISKAVVLLGHAADEVSLQTTYPSPFPAISAQCLKLDFRCAKGTAVKYLQETLGIKQIDVIYTKELSSCNKCGHLKRGERNDKIC